MDVSSLLPEAGRTVVAAVRITPARIEIDLEGTDESCCCPGCGTSSRRVHSRYVRTVRDLPWRGTPMILRFQTRRFFCDNPECRRKFFAEQLEDLAGRYRRSTPRREQTLVAIGLECGGEPGCRLSKELGIVTSGDTILRRLRAMPLPQRPMPAAIGIDDFALRRGCRYGTIVVDHTTGRPVDLLKDREVETVRSWLADHPRPLVVTRDRSSSYRKAITEAAPQAVQVADRWHLLANARETLVRVLQRHHRQVSTAAAIAQQPEESTPMLPSPAAMEIETISKPPDPKPLTKQQQLSADRRASRQARYEQVLKLYDQGISQRAIRRQTGMGRETVSRFLHAGSFPERAKAHRPKTIDRWGPRLRELWEAGEHNANALFRKLISEGFKGSSYMVRRYVAPWRTDEEYARMGGRKAGPGLRPRRVTGCPGADRLAWLLIDENIERKENEPELIEHLLADCPPVRLSRDLVQRFGQAVRQRSVEQLVAWATAASESDVPADVRGFAEDIVRDWAEVSAAMEQSYSNGRAEGHVNRLKLIKRKMYGRAKFDLLRIRVLAAH